MSDTNIHTDPNNISNSFLIFLHSVKKLEKLEELYQLSSVKNAEVRSRWIRIGLKGHWKDAIPRAVQMVTDQGRMKFLRPIYR